MNTNKHLDEQIKKALENLEAKYDPSAWEAFEQRLDSPVANGEPTLEGVIADKLGNLQVPLASGDWTMMEKMIEADEAAELIENEAAIDNLMYEKIGQMEMPFQPHHWQLMARRLEEEFILRYQIFRYKAAEVGLMFLLLLAIVRHMPVIDNSVKVNDLNNFPTQPSNLGLPSAPPVETINKNKPTTAPAKAKTGQPTTPIAAAQAPVKSESKSEKAVKNKAANATSSAGLLVFEENT
ncbi:MAG: hypothetical protein HY842_01145, partial [Bacteroidetes bacterium]|nr:hypothetical protein [Bacteroidota bacterium]